MIDVCARDFSYGSVPTRSGIDLQVIQGELLGIVDPHVGGKGTLVCHRADAMEGAMIQDLCGGRCA